MQEDVTPNYRGLKILVSVLGVVILIMLGLVAIGVAMRLTDQSETPATPAKPAASALPVPAGSRLIEVTPAQNGVYLHVREESGADHIYLLDQGSGALLWHRRLQPQE